MQPLHLNTHCRLSSPLPTLPVNLTDSATSLSPLVTLSQPLLQQAFPAKPQTKPAKKAGRGSVDLPLSFCSSIVTPRLISCRASGMTSLHCPPPFQKDMKVAAPCSAPFSPMNLFIYLHLSPSIGISSQYLET